MPALEWQSWGAEAFARARREDKPMLLALVAPWCEHCARMDRTTYAQDDVVRLVRERFVAVRVDSDRRPDINERYNLGGWPTTAFLTPDGVIFGGGTFIEADRMPDVLARVSETFARQRADIEEKAGRADQPRPAASRDADPLGWLLEQLIGRFDAGAGGFGDGPKFPHVAALALALECAADTGDSELARVVTGSLDGMAGLMDEVEGGFFRYAARRDWSEPHTGKVLQENAQIIRLHLDAAEAFGRPDYLERALAGIAWARRVLGAPPASGFAASQSADADYYRATAAARRSRQAPAVDPARHADANAEMCTALLRAAVLDGDPALRDLALETLEQTVLAGYRPGAGIAHVVAPEPDVWGLLADQVRTADALLAAHVATERLPYTMLAAELMEYAVRTMWDEEAGGFRDRAGDPETEHGLLREPLRPFVLNCEAARLLFRLGLVTGQDAPRERAERTLASLGAAYRDDPLLGAAYGLALREIQTGRLPRGLTLSPVDWKLAAGDDDDEPTDDSAA
jgi:hypothetical protein